MTRWDFSTLSQMKAESYKDITSINDGASRKNMLGLQSLHFLKFIWRSGTFNI